MKEDREGGGIWHHATTVYLKNWAGPASKAANKWFRWNEDGAGGDVHAGFPSTFQIRSPAWNNHFKAFCVAFKTAHVQYVTH